MARLYLFLAVVLLALPGLGRLYHGATGRLLVATYGIDKEPFRRSVVYIVHHDLFGAYGFIVNKPSVDSEEAFDSEDFSRWIGGPVQSQNPSFVLGRGQDSAAPWVFPKHGESPDDPDLFNAARAKIARDLPEIRGLFGYAGWTVFQLDWEIFRGRWAVIDYDPALVFDTLPEDMWRKAITRARENHQNGIDRGREPI